MILLTKFAESRGERGDTVRKYISRHKEMFEGHIDSTGKHMLLDDVAVELLEEVYPLPKPIEVVEDTESRAKLIEALERLEKAKDLIAELSNQCNQLKIEKMELETSQMLLEEKNKHEIEVLRSADESKNFKIQELETELETERTRKLSIGEAIRRILG